ncbi:MAG: DUF3572 domain-containing protein [Pseudomonadota bacterium]
MSQESAETLALSVLAWLAANDELLPVFMGSTGTSEADLRSRAGDAEFLGSVLDFVMMDDSWIMAVCDAHRWEYTEIASSRAALPGGEQVNWT